MKKIALFIFFIVCAISSFAQTVIKPMTFYANPSALDSIAYTYPGKTSLDWFYRARYIRQILGVTSAKDTLSIKDFIGGGTGADPFRLTTDTTRAGNFIVRYSNGFLGKDTSKYLPRYLHADWQTFTLGHNLLFGENAVNFYIQPGTPAGGIVATNPATKKTGIIGVSSNTSSLEYIDTAGNSSNILATSERASMISQGHSGHAYSLDLNNESSTTHGAFFTDTYNFRGVEYPSNYTPNNHTLIDKHMGDSLYLNKNLADTIIGKLTIIKGFSSDSTSTIRINSGVDPALTITNTNSSNAPALTVNGQLTANGQIVTNQSFYTPTIILNISPSPQPNIYLTHIDSLFAIERPGRNAMIEMRDSSIYTSNAGTLKSRFLTTADVPSGGAGTTSQSVTFNNSGSGASSGTTFNGSSAKTISYNTIGAQPQLSGTGYTKFSGTTPSYVSSIPNGDLANSSITVQGTSVPLGGSINPINGAGFVKASGTTISYDNSTYLTGNQTITLSGDISGSGTTAITGTLATVNSSPGSYGDASHSLSATVNGKGLITSLSTNSIQIAESQVTNLTSDLASKLTSSNFIASEIPSGSINSSNTSYTLANIPVSGTVKIYRNGLRQIVGTDYTISGTSITYLYAPTSGDTLLADYQK